MNGDPSHNPYQAPDSLWDRPAVVVETPPRRWLKVMLFLFVAATPIGAGLAAWEIESILGTGPVISLLGLAILVAAIRARQPVAALVGASGPGISLICWAAILMNGWGPGDAQEPISIVAAIYALVAVVAANFEMMALRQPVSAEVADTSWEQQHSDEAVELQSSEIRQ
ncbi:MAG: hypothetical protein R3C49_22335 [Planctomycetaceae bacterium]